MRNKRNIVEFSGGLSLRECMQISEEVESRLSAKALAKQRFRFSEFDDAQAPVVCLWSSDAEWLSRMRKILKASATIRLLEEGQGVRVQIESLPPRKPRNKFFAAGRKMLIRELFPIRTMFDGTALK